MESGQQQNWTPHHCQLLRVCPKPVSVMPGNIYSATAITGIPAVLTLAEAQFRDFQARLAASFPHDSYLSELTTLRD